VTDLPNNEARPVHVRRVLFYLPNATALVFDVAPDVAPDEKFILQRHPKNQLSD
jgi:hypothetical protein